MATAIPGDALLRLPFREIWMVDFEYIATPGNRPLPVCAVALEARSGRLLRLWQDELPDKPPFSIGEDSLFVAYNTSAEFSCFLVLGWPLPARILDPYAEFRTSTNGARTPSGYGLLSALSYHGLTAITAEQKTSMRDLILRGGPWGAAERRDILDYCQTDVDCLPALVGRMLPWLTSNPQVLGQALLRGRYMAAVARMEHAGVPIDTGTLGRLRANWAGIKGELITEIDKDYGVYDGTTFKTDRFIAYLTRNNMAWPLTDLGRPKLDGDTFSDMAKVYPQLSSLKTLRHDLAELRLERLAVGDDGRNRATLWPFGTLTGRNAPRGAFISGLSRWLRGLIQPAEGQVVAYLDWSSQEVAIAAALSGDPAMLAAVASGDPYLAFARMAGLAPEGATKETHGAIRAQCKTCVLGTNYGMGAQRLAINTGSTPDYAAHLLRQLARTFPVYWAWSQHVVDMAMLTGRLCSQFGWPLQVTEISRPTTLKNFPMQANGADMLRIACCLATEAGVTVCAPIHDALLIEAPAGEIGAAIDITRRAMADASRAVVDLEIGADTEAVVLGPARFSPDKGGQAMWDRVTGIIDRVSAETAVAPSGE